MGSRGWIVLVVTAIALFAIAATAHTCSNAPIRRAQATRALWTPVPTATRAPKPTPAPEVVSARARAKIALWRSVSVVAPLIALAVAVTFAANRISGARQRLRESELVPVADKAHLLPDGTLVDARRWAVLDTGREREPRPEDMQALANYKRKQFEAIGHAIAQITARGGRATRAEQALLQYHQATHLLEGSDNARRD